MENDILTVEEAAEFLKTSTKTIYKLINDKKLKATRVGRSWRITKTDIFDYLSKNANN